jgi:hypothetical protein
MAGHVYVFLALLLFLLTVNIAFSEQAETDDLQVVDSAALLALRGKVMQSLTSSTQRCSHKHPCTNGGACVDGVCVFYIAV